MTTKARINSVVTLAFCMLLFIVGHLTGLGPALGIGGVAGCLLYDSGRLIWDAVRNPTERSGHGRF